MSDLPRFCKPCEVYGLSEATECWNCGSEKTIPKHPPFLYTEAPGMLLKELIQIEGVDG